LHYRKILLSPYPNEKGFITFKVKCNGGSKNYSYFTLMGKGVNGLFESQFEEIPGPQTPDCLKYEGGSGGGGKEVRPRIANAASIVRDSIKESN
jgi:hypothetical protein